MYTTYSVIKVCIERETTNIPSKLIRLEVSASCRLHARIVTFNEQETLIYVHWASYVFEFYCTTPPGQGELYSHVMSMQQ